MQQVFACVQGVCCCCYGILRKVGPGRALGILPLIAARIIRCQWGGLLGVLVNKDRHPCMCMCVHVCACVCVHMCVCVCKGFCNSTDRCCVQVGKCFYSNKKKFRHIYVSGRAYTGLEQWGRGEGYQMRMEKSAEFGFPILISMTQGKIRLAKPMGVCV